MRPVSDEHCAKISAALKAYNQRPDAHLRRFHKSGPDHPNWRGGIKADYYQGVAYANNPRICNRCGSTDRLLIHHRDRNRRNSDPTNLEVLCRPCHNKEHHRQRVDWTCPACGSTISLRPFEARTRKFCSRACKMGARKSDGRF